MNNSFPNKLILASLFLLQACSVLQPVAVPSLILYRLELPKQVRKETLASPVVSIQLGHIHADSGLDSKQMLYVNKPYQINAFAQSQWQQTPALMLTPLVVSALEGSGQFQVVLSPTVPMSATYRLDLDIISLQQDFMVFPSQIHFGLRAYLSENKNSTLIALHEFDITVATSSEDAYGGVVASNIAVAQVLQQLTQFCYLQLFAPNQP